jgi:hypothetical protein
MNAKNSIFITKNGKLAKEMANLYEEMAKATRKNVLASPLHKFRFLQRTSVGTAISNSIQDKICEIASFLNDLLQ